MARRDVPLGPLGTFLVSFLYSVMCPDDKLPGTGNLMVAESLTEHFLLHHLIPASICSQGPSKTLSKLSLSGTPATVPITIWFQLKMYWP